MLAESDSRNVTIPVAAGVQLSGHLQLVPEPRGLVVFVHGSGSSRFSPRNQQVAAQLNKAGFGTLLFDLLTPDEEIEDRHSRHLRFDIPMLAGRLIEVIDWLQNAPGCAQLPIALFGASTGAAAALIAAAKRPAEVGAVVSRGGRPDLAGDFLAQVQASTLLIIGELDEHVLALNHQAEAQLNVSRAVAVVPGATHLFEEGRALEQVGSLAAQWFERHLQGINDAHGRVARG